MRWIALCLAWVVTPLAVQAQAPAEDAAPRESDPEAEAREAFREGSDAYAEARYGEAMRLFRRAYELSGRAALLYNIGLTADRLRDDAAAVEAFERYLASGEDARRDEVERRLAASRARLIASSVPDSRPDPARLDSGDVDPTPPAEPDGPSRAGPWAVGLTGAVLAVGGAVMLAVGARQVADVNDTPDGTRDWSDVSGDASRGRTLSILGASLLAVGTAAGVVSVSWRLATPDRSGDAGTERPREQAVTIHFRGSF